MIGFQQVIDQVLTYLKGIWIKKRYVIISSWLVCPIGWLYVVSLPDTYQSSARVYVDTNSLLRPLLRGLAVYNNPEQQVSLVARTLLSRPNLEKIAREADLDIKAKTAAEFDVVINDLKEGIKLSSTRDANIYTISYTAGTPALAQRIVQITLNEFIESNLGSTRKSSDSAEEFLERQISEYETRLKESEQRLADFKRNQQQILPGGAGDYYNQLKQERELLDQSRLRLLELESQLASAQAQIAGEEPVFGLMTPELSEVPGISTQYDARITAMQTRLDELLIRYTDQHPDVIKVKSLLERLKEERQEQLQSMSQVAQSTGSYNQFGNINQNPVYQQMKIRASNLESEIASIKVRVANYQDKVRDLEDKINLIPEMEAEFTGLNRDYGITKAKYEELLQRRESAQLSRKAEATTDDVQFRVIDPPVLPSKPSGPLRAVMYSAILIIGFGLGVAVAFVVSQINPVVVNYRQLVEHFNMPVIGAVSHRNVTHLQKVERRRMAIFLTSSTVLLLAYLFLMWIELVYGGFPRHLLGGLI
ncbi:Wzz/FepE/Etk N-terminal domain-containing protein [Aliiglaciecola sp. CAU 1673]|uniref:XrtA system polysaccharide chain length determinant n=1 Tax=Aliiglaciecola sp. CAU 1673 TaxID=3032595 RepID=UPI0023DB9768|nr:XrtA system polysaccharide chain length determinant [Aliiglaciecola sp. CAU 1673]MDF2180033.1 Wzz/FepE/Etk N-terminal domain-containing protein [Aliiglaciecola sp. CAU 1673]